jgi:hypothetical protein
VERLGDNADGEDSEPARRAGDHRGSAGAGAATHSGSHEHHVGAGKVTAELVDYLFGGRAADIGLRARAETSGRHHAHLDNVLGPHHGQRLSISVGNDKLDALQPGIDHVVDSVAARAADTKNGDSRLQLADVEIDAHGRPLGCKVGLTAKGRRAGLSLRRGVMAVGTASPR